MIKRFINDLGLTHEQLIQASDKNEELLFALIENDIIKPTPKYVNRYINRTGNLNSWYSDAFTKKIFDGSFDIELLNSLNVNKLNLEDFIIPEHLREDVLKHLYDHHKETDTIYTLLYDNQRKYKPENAVMIYDYINAQNLQPMDKVGHSQADDYEYILNGGDLEHPKLTFKTWDDFSIFNNEKYQEGLINALSYKISFNLEYKHVLQKILDQLGMGFIEKIIAIEPYTYTSILHDNLDIPSHTNNTKLFKEHVFTHEKVIGEIMGGVYELGRLINFESVKQYMIGKCGVPKRAILNKYRSNMTAENDAEIIALYTTVTDFYLLPLVLTIDTIKKRFTNTHLIDYNALCKLDINKFNETEVVDFIVECVPSEFIMDFVTHKSNLSENLKNGVRNYNNQLRLVEYNVNLISLFI